MHTNTSNVTEPWFLKSFPSKEGERGCNTTPSALGKGTKINVKRYID